MVTGRRPHHGRNASNCRCPALVSLGSSAMLVFAPRRVQTVRAALEELAALWSANYDRSSVSFERRAENRSNERGVVGCAGVWRHLSLESGVKCQSPQDANHTVVRGFIRNQTSLCAVTRGSCGLLFSGCCAIGTGHSHPCASPWLRGCLGFRQCLEF